MIIQPPDHCLEIQKIWCHQIICKCPKLLVCLPTTSLIHSFIHLTLAVRRSGYLITTLVDIIGSYTGIDVNMLCCQTSCKCLPTKRRVVWQGPNSSAQGDVDFFISLVNYRITLLSLLQSGTPIFSMILCYGYLQMTHNTASGKFRQGQWLFVPRIIQ